MENVEWLESARRSERARREAIPTSAPPSDLRPAVGAPPWQSIAIVRNATFLIVLLALAATAMAEHALAAQSPSGRGYEMVSPIDKNGGDVVYGNGTTRTSPDGERVAFDSNVIFAGGGGSGAAGSTSYFSERSAAGWTTRPLLPRQGLNYSAALFGGAVYGFSEDLSRFLFRHWGDPLVPDAQPDTIHLYTGSTAGGGYELVTQSTETIAPGVTLMPRALGVFGDATPDLGKVVFDSNRSYVPESPAACNTALGQITCPSKSYEWDGGNVRLVSVDESGNALTAGSFLGFDINSASGGLSMNTLSDDGSRVFFSASVGGVYGVYLRENGQTTKVNASERTVPDAPQAAQFLWATPDGAKVFFATDEALVDEDVDADPQTSRDIYAYTVDAAEGERLTRISIDAVAGDGVGAAARTVIAGSDDGSRIYFSAGNPLVPGQPTRPTGLLLYLWDGGEVKFVGSFGLIDGPDGNSRINPNEARTTPDGSVLVFRSSTERDPSQEIPEQAIGIYRYTVADGQTRCISCPDGSALPTTGSRFKSNQSGVHPKAYLPRALSSDGRRVFFTSREALVSADVNGVEDVYEWFDGETRLISSGRSTTGSFFMDATPDGSDVFFITRERLVGIDGDGANDLYVARNGPVLDQSRPARPDCAPGACQGEARSAPGLAKAGSAGLTSRGNVPSTRPRGSLAVRVARTSGRAKTVALRVRVPSAGSILVAGRSIRKARKRARRAGTYVVVARLKPKAARRLRRGGIAVGVRVAFRSRSGGSSSRTVVAEVARPVERDRPGAR